MPLSDNEKLSIATRKLTQILCTLKSWEEFKTFVKGINEVKIKNALATAFQDQEDEIKSIKKEIEGL